MEKSDAAAFEPAIEFGSPRMDKYGELIVAPRPKRLHFLDWLRLLLVLGVVYAHISKSGLVGGSGFMSSWKLDDRTLVYNAGYREAMAGESLSSQSLEPSPYSVRWISIIRQWCLPVLFWISGGAVACSYRGGRPPGLGKLSLFTAVGLSFNAVLWYLSPMREECYIDVPSCKDDGILFNFSIFGAAGTWFAIIAQMWYTLSVIYLSLLNLPMIAVMHGSAEYPAALLVFQTLLSIVAIGLWIVLSGDACPNIPATLLQLAVLEISFSAVLSLDAPQLLRDRRPRWLPLRLVHYALGLIAVLDFGWLEFTRTMNSVGPPYVAFCMAGFNKFFIMGFLLIKARSAGPGRGDSVSPLLSRAWPVMVILVAFVAPSTNWDLAGMLTFPFYASALDRVLYVAGAMVMTFVLDRVSRGLLCDPLPNLLGQASVVLYLFHPVMITVLLALGMRSVMLVCIVNVLLGVGIAKGFSFFHRTLQCAWQLKRIPRSLDEMSEVWSNKSGASQDFLNELESSSSEPSGSDRDQVGPNRGPELETWLSRCRQLFGKGKLSVGPAA